MNILNIKIKMDLIDQNNRLVKVRIEELESKIRSKKDLYYILR